MKENKMARALVVYATRTGQTKNIAELIAEGIRFSGMEAEAVNVTEVKKETDLEGDERRQLCQRLNIVPGFKI
jgi:menaquinone-dependent protoporphyrinogen IX oxidase